jgi:hypothetical protein
MSSSSQEGKNLSMACDFMRSLVDDPALLDQIPSNATIISLPDDDLAQREVNLELALSAARDGRNVYLHHVRSLSISRE